MGELVDDLGRFEVIPFTSSRFMTAGMTKEYDQWARDMQVTMPKRRRKEDSIEAGDWMGDMMEFGAPRVREGWWGVDQEAEKIGGRGFEALECKVGAGKGRGLHVARVRSIGKRDLDIGADQLYFIRLQDKDGKKGGDMLGIRVLEVYNGFRDLLHGATDGFRNQRSSARRGALILFISQGKRSKADKWLSDAIDPVDRAQEFAGAF